MHAAAVAEEIGVTRILVPPRPGAFSALGLLCSDVVHDYVRSELRPLDQVPPAHAETIFRQLENHAAAELAQEGLAAHKPAFERELDMRYTGQGYELRVSLAGLHRRGLDQAAMAQARLRFDAAHARIHGHAARERPVEIVSYRLRVRVTVPKYVPVPAGGAQSRAAPQAAIKGMRAVRFDAARETRTTLYERDRLPTGARLDGPAIVEQFDATTVVAPGWSAAVDRFNNLILTRKRSMRARARHG